MRAAKELGQGQGQGQTHRSNGTASVLSAPRQAALARTGGTSTPLREPLRPRESYTTDFVFDVPQDAQGLAAPDRRRLSRDSLCDRTRKQPSAQEDLFWRGFRPLADKECAINHS